MLWTIAAVFSILWLLGLLTGYTMGYSVHIPLFFAIIAMLIQIEDDCSDDGLGHTTKMYLKRQWVRISGRILTLAIPSRGKIPQGIIPTGTCRED